MPPSITAASPHALAKSAPLNRSPSHPLTWHQWVTSPLCADVMHPSVLRPPGPCPVSVDSASPALWVKASPCDRVSGHIMHSCLGPWGRLLPACHLYWCGWRTWAEVSLRSRRHGFPAHVTPRGREDGFTPFLWSRQWPNMTKWVHTV